MKSTFSILCIFALALFGCAGVSDNRGLSSLEVTVTQGGMPVVGEPVAIQIQNNKSELITDISGKVSADFTYAWNSLFWIIPPLGNIPRQSPSPKPKYSIKLRGEEFAPANAIDSAASDPASRRWTTKGKLDLKPN